MKIGAIVGGTAELIIKIVAFAFIVMFVFRAATTAYDYGYRVFAEEPVTVGEGRTISIYVEETDSAKEIGEIFCRKEKGLIRDAKLFLIQELLSENHGKIQPGIYDLNTSMTSQEMLSVMATVPEETEELPGTSVPSIEEITGISDSLISEEDGSGEETEEGGIGEGTQSEESEETSGEDGEE